MAANLGSTSLGLMALCSFLLLSGLISGKPRMTSIGGHGVVVSAFLMFAAWIWMVWS